MPTLPDLPAALEAYRAFPARLADAAAGLGDEELARTYRAGGWNVRQLVHHLADSHLHGYARMRFAVTAERPTILAYDQDAWAAQPDSLGEPVRASLDLVVAVHARTSAWLAALPAGAFERTVLHPEEGELSLAKMVSIYAWHGDHHLEQIRAALGV